MSRYSLVPRLRVAALGLLATTAAVPLILAPLTSAAAAPVRPASTGFGRAIEITPPRNTAAQVDSGLYGIACSGRGYCSAGGAYQDSRGNGQAMVVTESRGKWGRGVEVRLPRNAAGEPYAQVNGVACTGHGDCVAVGDYRATVGKDFAFIVSQRRGTWGRATTAGPLPSGTSTSALYAISCPAAGSCEAVGFIYVDSVNEGIVLTQVRGRWKQERTFRAPVGPSLILSGIACTRPGDCVTDGSYSPTDSATDYDAVGYVQSRGKWGRATTVAAPKKVSSPAVSLDSAACMASGSCLGAGGYEVGSSGYPMAVPESGGKWRAATRLPLPLHATGAYPDGVSCASARLCVVAGGYSTSSSLDLAYLASLVSGRWKDAGGVILPANAISPAHSFLYAVSCASDGYCATVGYYYYYLSENTGRSYPMVATRG